MKRTISIKPVIALAGLLLILSASSCSKKVDSNDLKEEVPYYQTYEVSYDKDNSKTNATAVFQVRETSGAKIELTNNNTVTANSAEPTTEALDQTKYKWEFSSLQDVKYILTKNGNTTVTNTVSQTDVGEIGFGTDFPLSASKKDGFKFTWTGPALAANETLTVTARKLSIPVATKTITGSEVQFISTDLTAAVTGTLFITLKRTKKLELDAKDGTAGGSITVSTSISKDMALNE